MMEKDNLEKRVLSLQRTFNAPVKLVWDAWSEPGHIAKWWGPANMEPRVLEHDFRVGGNWKYAMTMPNGAEFLSIGVFTEIVPLKRIVSNADFPPMTANVIISAFFEDLGDKTKFVFSVTHETEEYCKAQEKMGFMNGWGSVFDGLGNYLDGLDK